MRHVAITLLAWLCALFSLPGWAAAASAPGVAETARLVIEGKSVKPDVPPVIRQGRTLVPVRVIAEGLGAEVKWDQKTRTATVDREGTHIILRLDSRQAQVNGRTVTLDTPPLLYGNRMLLPVRFVGESMGAVVGWDPSDRTVIVNRPVQVQVNGQDVTREIPVYKRTEGLYIPIGPVAERAGMNPRTVQLPPGSRTIDGQAVVLASGLGTLIDGDVAWDAAQNRISIERINQLTGVVAEGQKVSIHTTKSVAPQHFTLQGPHRIVIDLPQTVLSDELKNALQAGTPSSPPDQAAQQPAADGSASLDQAAQQPAADGSAQPLIKTVRYSQYSMSPRTVRIVVELSQPASYKIAERPDGVDVTLQTTPVKKKFLVVIDAGHGGTDPGAQGAAGNYEKDFTLGVANRLVRILQQMPDIQVVATRSTDVYLTLQQRVAIANNAQADLFLSIHANKFTRPEAGGTETYYYTPVSAEFANVVHRHLIAATGFLDRGVKTAPFYVIKNTKMPSVLIEAGFVSNPQEDALMMTPAFQEKVAQSLADAIREYYQSHR